MNHKGLLLRLSAITLALTFPLRAFAAVDLATPKASAKSFYEALSNADTSAMRDCLLIEGDDQQQLATAFLDVILSGKKLGDAAKEKFGASGDKIAAGTLNREDAAAIENAKQSDAGDDATIAIEGNPKPLRLRKTPAGWKLILLETKPDSAKPDNLAEQIKLLTSLSAAMNDTATDLNAGRYPTPDDAMAAIQQRLSEVMVKRYKPATTQASPAK